MQPQASSSRESSRSSAVVVDAASVFDGLLADHLTVAAAFDLIQHELEQAHPDREVCCQLLLQIDALLAAHAQTKVELLDSVFDSGGAADDLYQQLDALIEVDRVWSAKARNLMERLEQRILLEDEAAAVAACSRSSVRTSQLAYA